MSDYECNLCGKKATVHITKFINGQKLKFHLCESCAKNNQDKLKALIETQVELKAKKGFHVEDIIADMLEEPKKSTSTKQCKYCKNTFEAFEKNARVPCEHCYEAFSKKFDEILGQMHLSIEHKGKVIGSPKKAKARAKKPLLKPEEALGELKPLVPSLEDLTMELELAISQERYEDAALLRDKIKILKDLD